MGVNAMGPTLTVGMANYNHAKFLPTALASVVEQSRHADEVIVIDDASTDSSVEIAESFAQRHSNVRVVVNPQNRGVAFITAEILRVARSSHLLLLASDDYVLPGFFEQAMSQLGRNPQAGLVTARSRRVDEAGADEGIHPSPLVSRRPRYLAPAEVAEELIRHEDYFGMTNATIWRRDAITEFGGYRSELSAYADVVLGTVVALKYGACFLPEPLAVWRQRGDGFFHTYLSRPDLIQAVAEEGYRLMTEEWAEWVPETYADRWRARQEVLRGLAIERASEARRPGRIVDRRVPGGEGDLSLYLRAPILYRRAGLKVIPPAAQRVRTALENRGIPGAARLIPY